MYFDPYFVSTFGEMYSFHLPFLAPCSISSQRVVLSIPVRNPTETPGLQDSRWIEAIVLAIMAPPDTAKSFGISSIASVSAPYIKLQHTLCSSCCSILLRIDGSMSPNMEEGVKSYVRSL